MHIIPHKRVVHNVDIRDAKKGIFARLSSKLFVSLVKNVIKLDLNLGDVPRSSPFYVDPMFHRGLHLRDCAPSLIESGLGLGPISWHVHFIILVTG